MMFITPSQDKPPKKNRKNLNEMKQNNSIIPHPPPHTRYRRGLRVGELWFAVRAVSDASFAA